MTNIIDLGSGMNQDKKIVKVDYHSTSKKWVEAKAEALHNEVVDINGALMEGKYTVHTAITGEKSKSNYTLKVKIKFYKDAEMNEHKKNSHRQKINI